MEIDRFLDALDEYLEARDKVRRSTSDDGYCPTRLENAEADARKALRESLERYVDTAIHPPH